MSDRHALARQRAGVWLALVSAVLFSAKAILVKLGYREGVDPEVLLALRMLLSLPFLLGALAWSLYRDHQQAALSRHDLLLIGLAGLLGYYGASLFDFMGLAYVSAGLERLILFTYPSIVLLIHSAQARRWPPRQAWMAMAVCYAGLLVVYGGEVRLEGAHVHRGAALVFLSAICYGSYLVLSGHLLARLGTLRVTALATLVACAAVLAQVALTHPWQAVLAQTPAVWRLSAANAVFCTVVPIFTLMAAIARIGSARVSQIGMVGPLSTIGLGTLVLGEPFGLTHVLGTALVLWGIVLLGRRKPA